MTFLKTTTVAAGPTALNATTRTAHTFTVLACKGLDGPTASPNAGTVKIGQSGTASEQPWELEPGGERTWDLTGGVYDLSKFWLVVATDGDGVVVSFQ